MVLLWLLVVVVGGASAALWVRRTRLTRSAADTHRRVLTTLDAITSQPGEHPGREREGEEVRQHVRLVRSDSPDGLHSASAAPRFAPRRGRSLGAAAFRAPIDRNGPAVDAPSLGVPPAGAAASTPSAPPLPAVPALVVAPVAAAPAQAAPAQAAPGPAAAPVPVPASVAATPPGGSPAAAPTHLRTRHTSAVRQGGQTPGRPGLSGHRPPTSPGVRARRLTVLLVLAGVVVAAAAIAVVFAGRGGPPHTRRAASPVRAPITVPPPTTTTPAPTTTVPKPVATLVSSNPQVAVYSLAGPATITFRASSGASWAQLRRGDQSGAVVFQGSLDPGHAQTITGPAWVRLGNPTAVSVAVNGVALTAPTLVAGQPYNFQFR